MGKFIEWDCDVISVVATFSNGVLLFIVAVPKKVKHSAVAITK